MPVIVGAVPDEARPQCTHRWCPDRPHGLERSILRITGATGRPNYGLALSLWLLASETYSIRAGGR